MKLITHIHLLPRLKMCQALFSFTVLHTSMALWLNTWAATLAVFHIVPHLEIVVTNKWQHGDVGD
jgi:hypothetical protein